MSGLAGRIDRLPRAGKWLVGAAGALAAYFLLVEPTLDLKMRIDARADRVAARLASFRQGAGAREEARQTINRGVSRVGPAAFPEDQAQRSQAFNRRLDELFGTHGIRERTTRTRTSALSTGPLQPLIPSTMRLDRLIADIQFSAAPETVSALLADLEQSPEVAAVSRLSLEKAGGERALTVGLTVETWVLARKEAR